MNLKNKIVKHETKRKALFKFFSVFLIFIIYLAFISWKYGLEQGFLVAVLSWSFFVLCTPVADAGFLISFPLRLFVNIRMIFSQIAVWFFAVFLNLYIFLFSPEVYLKTKLLTLFKKILENPFPFWSIILISAIGTFVSIRFGDELMDTKYHHERFFHKKYKNKHGFIMMIFLFTTSFVFYKFLLSDLGISF